MKYQIEFRYFDNDTKKYVVIDRSTPHSHKWCTDFLKRSGYKRATSHWVGVWSTTEGTTAYVIKTNNK